MVRTWSIVLVLMCRVAFAQYDNGGVWTGYVGGWKPNTSPAMRSPVSGPRFFPRQQQPVFVPYFVSSGFNARQDQEARSAAAEQAEQRRAWEAEQARQQLLLQVENERRVAAEREALLQQQLEAERRLSAEREALAQERLKLERESAARVAVVLPPPPPPEPARPEAPRTPGNDIYRWTDSDGVVHYSTNVPDSARPLAKRVGGR